MGKKGTAKKKFHVVYPITHQTKRKKKSQGYTSHHDFSGYIRLNFIILPLKDL